MAGLTAGRALVLLAAGSAVVALARSRRARRAQPEVSDVGEPFDPQLPEGRTQTVTTDDGARLHVLVAGPDDGPTVVLSHCWTGTAAVWAPVARRLVLDGHRVVLYDQRGHGRSTLGDLPPSIDLIGHDLLAVLRAVDAHQATLAGHSMGGMAIQSYAALHPDDFAARVTAVVLVATAARVLGRTVPAVLIDRAMGDGRAEWARRGRIGQATVRRSFGDRADRAHIEHTLESLAATSGIARAGFLTAMAGMDLRPGLTGIRVPTTVLVGTRDRLTPPRLARQLAGAIDGSDLVVLPGAGHMLPLEATDRVVDAIRTPPAGRAANAGAAPACASAHRP